MSKFGSLFTRVITYVANELFVKALANSKTFQRFAVKTDSMIQQNKAKVEAIAKEGLAKVEDSATNFAKDAASVRAEIDKVKLDLSKYQREGNLDKVAEITYGKLPMLESKLQEAETPVVTRYLKQFNDHIFAKEDNTTGVPKK